jgi:hypothetical protein
MEVTGGLAGSGLNGVRTGADAAGSLSLLPCRVRIAGLRKGNQRGNHINSGDLFFSRVIVEEDNMDQSMSEKKTKWHAKERANIPPWLRELSDL